MSSNTSTAAGGGVWGSVEDLVMGLTGHWDAEDTDSTTSAQAWLCSVVAATIIGLAGIVPLIVIPSNYSSKSDPDKQGGGNLLQLLLSFAVGGLLADVFLHLLPEAWTAALEAGLDPHEAFTRVGLCVLFGIFVFIIVEMLATGGAEAAAAATQQQQQQQQQQQYLSTTPKATAQQRQQEKKTMKTRSSSGRSNTAADSASVSNVIKSISDNNYNNNNSINAKCDNRRGGDELQYIEVERKIEVVGYLNLIANGIDNFAHGLAVAGSFMVSYKTGVLTTTAILIHEVPHEIGDFAILLSSGFSRWEAAKAQLYTASIGLLGALFTLCMGSSSVVGGIQLYILGFTAGAFLNISLCSVLPQLLKEERPTHSAAQMVALLVGTYTMSALAC